MKSGISRKILFFILVLTTIGCILWLFLIFKPVKNPFTEYKSTTISMDSDNNSGYPENPIHFKELQKKNKDVYAWITIPGTNVDYPVVQASSDKNDNFYLDHNIDQEYEFSGMIYSQRLNSKSFSDPVTILYGHNMLNGSMFATLHRFEGAKFFQKHDTMTVYTPGHILTYRIVAAYIYDNRHILNTFDFSSKKELKNYYESIMNPKSMVKNVRDGLSLSTTDHILTLSTCTSSDSQRYLVQGVLTNDTITK